MYLAKQFEMTEHSALIRQNTIQVRNIPEYFDLAKYDTGFLSALWFAEQRMACDFPSLF
jgi:hypothetical protein